jgi:cytidine kinase
LYRQHGINLDGLQVADGPTFRWSGEYEWDLNKRRTLSVCLNVFETFQPGLPEAYKATPYVLLANISPQLQMHVLAQVSGPKFVVADTMDLWIETQRDALVELAAPHRLSHPQRKRGPRIHPADQPHQGGPADPETGPEIRGRQEGRTRLPVVRERYVFQRARVSAGRHPRSHRRWRLFCRCVHRLLWRRKDRIDPNTLRNAVIHGSVIASYCVEDFSLTRLESLTQPEIKERYDLFQVMSRFEMS